MTPEQLDIAGLEIDHDDESEEYSDDDDVSQYDDPTLDADPNDNKNDIVIDYSEVAYASKKQADNTYKWVAIPSELVNKFDIQKFVHGDDFESKFKYDYKGFLNGRGAILKRELKKHNIEYVYLQNQGQWEITGTHFVDYMFDDAALVVDIDNVTTLIFDDVLLYRAATGDGKLYISYTMRSDDDWHNMLETLSRVCGDSVKLPKDRNTNIRIKLAPL